MILKLCAKTQLVYINKTCISLKWFLKNSLQYNILSLTTINCRSLSLKCKSKQRHYRSSIKIWGKSFQGFSSYDRTDKERLLLYFYGFRNQNKPVYFKRHTASPPPPLPDLDHKPASFPSPLASTPILISRGG